MNRKFLAMLIFSMGLLGCPPSSPHGTQPQKVLLPVWQQTEYIFYNKTGSQVIITFVEKGKVRKKDGTVIERSDGGSQGEDGIFREFIINESGDQEYVTREYEETSLELEDGECIFTPSYYVLDLEIGGRMICGTYRHGSPDPERPCSDEVNTVRNGERVERYRKQR